MNEWCQFPSLLDLIFEKWIYRILRIFDFNLPKDFRNLSQFLIPAQNRRRLSTLRRSVFVVNFLPRFLFPLPLTHTIFLFASLSCSVWTGRNSIDTCERAEKKKLHQVTQWTLKYEGWVNFSKQNSKNRLYMINHRDFIADLIWHSRLEITFSCFWIFRHYFLQKGYWIEENDEKEIINDLTRAKMEIGPLLSYFADP